MRTKKIITLVLVLALALSAVSFGASASFSDIEENNANRTYYDLLAGLGIIKGYDDGTFKEANPVTREEAVAFIYRMANGNDNALKGATAFPDVASDRWSSGYVNWAVGKGIVAGYPDGTFKPTNTVTVAEMAKMMVVALGWPSNNYTFPYGFINKAQDLQVLDNINAGNVDQPCTRAMVSVITYNTLTAQRIEFTIVNGYPQQTNLPTFLASGRFNAKSLEGQVINGTSTMAATNKITKAGQVDISGTAVAYVGNADDLIGRTVTVWYKNDSGKGDSLTSDSTIIALVPDAKEKVATVKMADIDDGKIKIDGVKYPITSIDKAITGDVDDLTDAGNKTNTLLRVVYTDDAIKKVYSYTSYVQKVSKVASNGSVTFVSNVDTAFNNKTIKADYLDAYEGIAKDDIVYVAQTSRYVAADKAVSSNAYIVEKADIVSGVAYTSSKNGTYVFGGTEYKLSSNASAPAGSDLGSSFDLILSPSGFIKEAKAATTNTSKIYGVVTGYSQNKTSNIGPGKYENLTVQVMTADGVEKTYPVSEKADSTNTYIAANKGGWVDYSEPFAKIAYQPVELALNSEGTVTTLKVATTNQKATYTFNKTSKILSVSSGDTTGSFTVNGSTAVFSVVWKDASGNKVAPFAANASSVDVSATTGDKLGSMTADILGMMAGTDGVKAIKVISFNGGLSASSDKTGYIKYEGMKWQDGKSVYSFIATVGNAIVSLYTEEAGVADDVAGGFLDVYTPVYGTIAISGSELTGFTQGSVTDANATVTAINGNVISLKNSDASTALLTAKSDVRIYNLERKGEDDYTISGIMVPGAEESLPTLENISEDTHIAYVVVNDADSEYNGMISEIYILNK